LWRYKKNKKKYRKGIGKYRNVNGVATLEQEKRCIIKEKEEMEMEEIIYIYIIIYFIYLYLYYYFILFIFIILLFDSQ